MRGLLLTWLALIALGGGAKAADVSASMPTKAPPQTAPVAYDWTGFYAGAHLGYAAGSSHWSAIRARRPLSGSLDLFNAVRRVQRRPAAIWTAFRPATTTCCRSRVVVGAEADIVLSKSSARRQLRHSPVIERPGGLPGTGRILRHAPRAHRLRTRQLAVLRDGRLRLELRPIYPHQLAGMPAGGTALPGSSTITSRCRASARRPAAASKFELVPIGRRGWNISIPITARSSVAFPDAGRGLHSDSSSAMNCAPAWIIGSADWRRCRSAQRPCAARSRLLRRSWPIHFPRAILCRRSTSPYRGANSLTPQPGPRDAGTPRSMPAGGCGRAPNCGSTRKSIRVLG